MSAFGRLRIGLSERLLGPCVDEIQNPPVIPGWRLVDIEDVDPEQAGELLIVATASVARTRLRGAVTFTPTADAFYVREVALICDRCGVTDGVVMGECVPLCDPCSEVRLAENPYRQALLRREAAR